ncbi:MAG: phosphoenolpyruvate--protein phosphotransferase [Anaerolineaceae bacterium]|nr:phosphoenolpyruvate--protein phosphotransferase [Anaerolineaceae bacterium]
MKAVEVRTLTGIPAAPGLAHGKTITVTQRALEIPNYSIQDFDGEIHRLESACETGQEELKALKDNVGGRTKTNEAEIFEAHRMILEDVALLDQAKKAIRNGVNAEKAWMDAIEFFAQMMEQIPDPTLSSRAVDIRDVGQRVLGHLLGVGTGKTALSEPSIIVGDDLAPSDTVSLDKDLVLGFITARGGPTSHTAILAKAFGLPAVVGLGEAVLSIPEGTRVLVDGAKGEVVVAPDDVRLADFIALEKQAVDKQNTDRDAAQAPAVTADGERVEVVANIGGLTDAPLGAQNGAEGVGLFRTEFLYLDRNALPTEAEQIEAYQAVFSHYQGQPVVVRTLDIGGDKTIPYLDLPVELNPFLGWRGIRMADGAEDIFLTQFRALLQAGVGVDLRIMVPMVSGIAEIRMAKGLMEKAKAELKAEGKAFTDQVEFGIMIEVPSAALLADKLAKEIDFFSIGTNDLTQYTLAVDRTNSKVARLASPFNPAVLTLIKRTIDSAHAEGKWVGLCGELAGEPVAAPILLGLGLDEFSMSPARVPVIKKVMRKLSKTECVSLAEDVLGCIDADEVQATSQAFISQLGLAED